MSITRRKLLNVVARLGGAAAVYETLAAWDFLKAPRRWRRRSSWPKDSGARQDGRDPRRRRRRACARPTSSTAPATIASILEASQARRRAKPDACGAATRFSEMGGPVQECRFDEGLYFNAGPGRIPHQHVHVIDYCRRFGVALQPYIFASRANLVHSGYTRQRPHHADAPRLLRSAGPYRRTARQVRGQAGHGPADRARRPRNLPRHAVEVRRRSPRSSATATPPTSIATTPAARATRCRRGLPTSRAGRSARWRSTKSCARTSGTTSSSATPNISGRPRCWSRSAAWINFFKGFLRQPSRKRGDDRPD